jgi:hypothetical protein
MGVFKRIAGRDRPRKTLQPLHERNFNAEAYADTKAAEPYSAILVRL